MLLVHQYQNYTLFWAKKDYWFVKITMTHSFSGTKGS
ncbi:hypothetical protein AA637_11520 [Cyanobacterium sp. HL-69]|nr:hypothetical protein AA637_11520 [Cyanobacterium sp. HL-69]